MVAPHLVQAALHDERQGLEVRAVDHLAVHKRVFDQLEQFLGLDFFHRVALDGSYHRDAVNFLNLKSLLVVVLVHVFDVVNCKVLFGHLGLGEDVRYLNEAIWTNLNAFFGGAMPQDKAEEL